MMTLNPLSYHFVLLKTESHLIPWSVQQLPHWKLSQSFARSWKIFNKMKYKENEKKKKQTHSVGSLPFTFYGIGYFRGECNFLHNSSPKSMYFGLSHKRDSVPEIYFGIIHFVCDTNIVHVYIGWCVTINFELLLHKAKSSKYKNS